MVMPFMQIKERFPYFHKGFSENELLYKWKSNLIFTAMQKRRFDARGSSQFWLADTLERFVDL